MASTPGSLLESAEASNFCFVRSTDYDLIYSDLANALRYRTAPYSDVYKESTMLAIRGKVHFQLGEYKEALDDLEAAMRSDIENADDIFGSGETKPETANESPCVWTMTNLDVLEQRFPKDYRVPLLRGIYITFFATFEEKFYAQATDEFHKAALLSPHSPLPHYFLGAVQIKSSFWTRASGGSGEKTRLTAILHFTKAVQLDPSFTLAYRSRAGAYAGVKEYAKAIADFTKVLELDDKDVIAWADRGLANLETGRYSAATVDFGQAIRLSGEDSNTLLRLHESRADAYAKLGMYRDALSNYSQAIKHQLVNLTHLISIQQFRGLYPEYEKVSDDDVIRKVNTLFWPQYDFQTMKKVMTEKTASKQWQISTSLTELYEKRGDCYLKLHDYRRGVLDFNRIFKGVPTFGQYVERWRSMGGIGTDEWFIDVQSTEFGSTPRLWAKFSEKAKGYTVQAFDFDCTNRRIATTAIAKYNHDDELTSSSEEGSGWQRIFPQTRGEQMYLGMCGR